ncbi:MAG: efflux RND transporter periplasmic adaptor subunit [Lyngbya sp. HA4199-MV5]|jgi:multidrug efflux pump subunit AcrA (membrane-fusion protein)|nr:efflux RND transporter periplasmic adaptor subunit [Lyngbya sp. HA4199-MV5]
MNTYPIAHQLTQFGLLCLVVAGLGACRQGEPAANAQPAQVSVKLATVQSSTLADSSEYVANLESRQSVTLRPRVEGQVSQICVTQGAEVAAGTPIIQIDPARQQASVNSVAAAAGSQADLENARATLENYRAERFRRLADLKFNRSQYESYNSLYASGAVSRQTANQYLNGLEVAQANVGAIEAQIKAQQATIARNQRSVQQAQATTQEQSVQLQYFNIAAPYGGKIGRIPVKVGDFVNTSTELATITQNNELEVNISIPIERAARIRIGTAIELLDADGKRVGTSRVFFIAPNTANNTQSLLVKSLFNNANNQLRADQYVRARVIWDQRPGVTIPTSAISRVAGETFVFVAEPDKAGLVVHQRPVKLGTINGNSYQVLDGLKAGDRIAVSGLLKLTDGATITSES